MDRLPEEIVLRIFAEVGRGELTDSREFQYDRRLINTMRSCKRFYRIARPLLYRTLWITEKMLASLQDSLQPLVDTPGTASYVRTIVHRGADDWFTRGQDTKVPCAESLLAGLEVSKALREDIRRGLLAGYVDATAAILLCVCKNVTSLEIESFLFPQQEEKFDQTCTARLVNEFAHRKDERSFYTTSRSPLRQLKTLNLCSGFLDLRQMSVLWRLPSLETFRCRSSELFWSPDDHHVDTIKSNLRRVTLSDVSELNHHGLSRILDVCPSLQELSLSVLRWNPASNGTAVYDPIGNVLRRQGTRLERFMFCDGIGVQSYGFDVLGSLKELNRLKTLCLFGDPLYGPAEMNGDQVYHANYLINILPESLQRLVMHRADQWSGNLRFLETFDRQLLELMVNQGFGRLESIYIERVKDFHLQVPEGWQHTFGERPAWIELDADMDDFNFNLSVKQWMCLEKIRD